VKNQLKDKNGKNKVAKKKLKFQKRKKKWIHVKGFLIKLSELKILKLN